LKAVCRKKRAAVNNSSQSTIFLTWVEYEKSDIALVQRFVRELCASIGAVVGKINRERDSGWVRGRIW
jgi:hypothetical protein